MAQARHHSNLWSRLTVSAPVTDRLGVDLEAQYRRQNICRYDGCSGNMLMTSFRAWLSYKLNKQWQLSASPLAYFIQSPVVNESADLGKPRRQEWRVSFAQQFQQPFTEKLGGFLRIAEEWRQMEGSSGLLRLRCKAGAKLQLSGATSLNVYDELLVNAAGIPESHVFDQNRTGFDLKVHWSSCLSSEFGYMHVSRLQPLSATMGADDNAIVSLTLQISHHH